MRPVDRSFWFTAICIGWVTLVAVWCVVGAVELTGSPHWHAAPVSPVIGYHPPHDGETIAALRSPLPSPSLRAARSEQRKPVAAVQPQPFVTQHWVPRSGPDARITFANAAQWAHSLPAVQVANCESHGPVPPGTTTYIGNIRDNTGNGYFGKWQASLNFWTSYGGLQYAPRPDLATEAQQDIVAFSGWLARGWAPWQCRSAIH